MFKFLESRKVILVYIPFVIYWIILFTATTLPSEKLPSMGVSDKLNHFTAYLTFAVLLNLTLLFQNKFYFLKKNSLISTIFIGIFYGIIDELHQMLIPGRSAEFLDWIADSLGVLSGVLIVYLLKKFSNYKLAEN